MTHERWTDQLSDYLDGELSAGERLALEAHLAGCAACSATLDELRWVVARARTLSDTPPAEDLWPAIAALVGGSSGAVKPSPVVPIDSRRRISFSIPQLAAAGIVLAFASGAAGLAFRGGGTPEPTVAGIEAPATPVVSVASSGTARMDSAYGSAVSELRAVLDAGRGSLDTTTVRVLETNLALIDSAVASAQRALAVDPANAYLSAHLARTMRRKLDLLRHAATLVTVQS
jgi:anti-sigma factor RsiW